VSPENKDAESRAWARALREMGPFLGIGATLAVTVLGGIGVGYWLDGRLGTTPAFVLAGAVVGVLAAGYHFYRLVRVKR
jgi:F0F1-type ATP synthase assembly protein I